MAKMGLRREQQLERYIRWERGISEKSVRLVMIVYTCTKGLRTVLIEAVVSVSLGRPILEEVLGGMGTTVDMGDILDRLILNLRFYRFRLS